MVSGFLTSPCDHCRMSSAVASPIRSSSKKLTSSTLCQSLFRGCVLKVAGRGTPAAASDLFNAARLTPGQVDAEFLRRTEDVLVRVAHLDRHAVAGEHLDVEAQ